MRRRWSVSGVDSRRGGDERASLRPETDLLLLLLLLAPADLSRRLPDTCTLHQRHAAANNKPGSKTIGR